MTSADRENDKQFENCVYFVGEHVCVISYLNYISAGPVILMKELNSRKEVRLDSKFE